MPTQTFNYTGGQQTWTVPSGVSTVTVRCWGAQGGGGTGGGNGANGGFGETTLNVSAGETLYIYVGERGNFGSGSSGGSGGWPNGGDGGTDDPGDGGGGGGGGSSGVRYPSSSVSDQVCMGGGGGGNDWGGFHAPGRGGGTQGEDGDGGYWGEGGTQSSGGDEGGSRNQGGDGVGGQSGIAGGGGGGGYYGGGGSDAAGSYDGAGGGGSGYGDTLSVGGNSGHGVVEVEYTEAPAAPNNVAQTVVGDDEIDITWDEDTSRGSTDDYDVQVSEDGGTWTQVTNTTAESYTYTATPSVNDHQFRVRANNSAGSSDWVYTTTKTTDPTGLSVDGHDADSIDLSWTGTDDQSNYRVLRAESSEGSYTEAGTPTGTTFTDTSLENGEQYFYVVEAEYAGTNSQQTNEVSQITDLPALSLDSLDAAAEDEITVSWTLNDNSSDGEVEVYRSTDGSLGSVIHTETTLGTTAYTDTGLADGGEYHYTLRRVTDHAQAESGQLSAVTVLPAPSEVSTTLL